jgi:hypothetical protein
MYRILYYKVKNWGSMITGTSVEIERKWGGEIDKRRWPLCLGIEAGKNVLLRCLENR